jgi:hypothetical protein
LPLRFAPPLARGDLWADQGAPNGEAGARPLTASGERLRELISMELIDLSSLACPGCHEPVDDGNEGFVHMADGTPLCRGEIEPVEVIHPDAIPVVATTGRTMGDTDALDAIAHLLRDPKWAFGMLEDIATFVVATGRSVQNLPDDPSTWIRH